MPYLLAIDPGDEHVGVAFFEEDPEEKYGWRCVDAQQTTPDEFLDSLAWSIIDGDVHTVVYERFRLYADKAVLQTGSEFQTSQMIGVIKWLVRNHNAHVKRHQEAVHQGTMLSCEVTGGPCADPGKWPRWVEIHGQMADIKKPTMGILRKRKMKSTAKTAKRENPDWGDHPIDAELHGWHYILHVMDEQVDNA